MASNPYLRLLALASALSCFCSPALTAAGPALVENLGRGVVAIRTSPTEVFVSWRLLGTDPADIAFNLYRSSGGEPAVKLNGQPLTGPTHFTDNTADLLQTNSYFVRPIISGLEYPSSGAYVLPADAPVQQYLRVPLQRPPDGTSPAGTHSYSPNDTSVGDLDGDGEYELIVKWEPSNQRDSSQDGFTGNTLIDAYRLDGTFLWRIDLGINVRAGPHDTPFHVYDLDGDGRAEVFMRTAEGTIAGDGQFVADPAKFHGPYPAVVDHTADRRGYPNNGRALVGPEFLTIFDGLTGAELASTKYLPARHPDTDFPTPQELFDVWGDTSGNRQGRHYSPGVAYLDGQRPSIVMGRGYAKGQNNTPGRIALAAWDYRDGVITPLWQFDSRGHAFENDITGQGAHSPSVADLNGDGLDDIVYGQLWVLNDGTLYRTGWGHGDALHVSNMDPDRPGQQVFMPHESPAAYGPNALSYDDGLTRQLLVGVSANPPDDIGRGVAADIDPRFRGFEFWGAGATGGLYNVQSFIPNAELGPRGLQVSPVKPGPQNHLVWWDGDLLRELLDGTTISKWNWISESVETVLQPPGIASINGTKSNPNLQVDILGDWREEVVWRETSNDALRIYVTTIPTEHRLYTLMHDRQYRIAIQFQNVGYNQPPHTSFYLGDGMAPPPVPDIVVTLSQLLGPPKPVFTGITTDTGTFNDDNYTGDNTLLLHGTAAAGATVNLTRVGVGAIGSTVANGSGQWTFDYTSTPLPEGLHYFTATASNALGTSAESLPFLVVIDTTPPDAPTINALTDGAEWTFSGTAEPGATVIVALSGGADVASGIADEDGRWSATLAPLSTGSYSFVARALDLAENVSPLSAPHSVNTSIGTPTLTGIVEDNGPSGNDGITNDTTLVLNGTGPAGATIIVSITGVGEIGTTIVQGNGTWSFDYTGTPLMSGAYEFSAVASVSGSSGLTSTAFNVVINTEPPTVVSSLRLDPPFAIVGSVPGITLTYQVTFSAAVVGVDLVDFSLTATGTANATLQSVTPVSESVYNVTAGNLSGEGALRLDVNATGTGITDIAGNALAGGFTGGATFTLATEGDSIWLQPETGGLWSDPFNWQAFLPANGVDSTANFSTLDILADNTVHLDSARNVGHLAFGDLDTSSAASWIIDNNGNAANTLTLAVSAGAPTINVPGLGSGASTILGAGLGGSQGLTKTGTGLLQLTAPSTLFGPLNVSTGVLRLGSGGSLDVGMSPVDIGANGQLNVAGGSFATDGEVVTPGGSFVLDGGSAVLNGGFRTNSDFNSTLRVNGGSLSASSVDIRRNSAGGNPNFGSGFIVAGGTATVGTIGLGTHNSNGAMSIEGSGSLTATGPIIIGNQRTGGRGGGMRVLNNARFLSIDTELGVVISKAFVEVTVVDDGADTVVTNVNNVASATFTGGVSTLEKFTLGAPTTVLVDGVPTTFDVTAGSATITINGGAVYLGSGGIVKPGTFTTNLNFSSGILGAKADWSTNVNINLPNNGNIAFKSADEENTPHDITLSGVLGGAGGFTKTGAGRLTLVATNTFTGAVNVNGGTLEVDGAIAASANPLQVNATGIVTGDGTIARAVQLNSGGTIMPGNATPASMLTVGSLLWNSNGALAYDLDDSSNTLAVTGAFTKGGDAPHSFVFNAGPGIAAGNIYTLVTFGSTDFTAADFSFGSLAPGLTGAFFVNANDVQFKVYGPPIILESPQDAIVRFGGTATFTVGVGESPNLSYQWYKDNEPISGATEATLTIANVQGYDIGSYHVVVTNGAGSTPSAPATLSIAALALTNRGPMLNSALVEGSIQQMLGFNATLNGDMVVAGDLLVPGTPNIVLNGSPTYGGTIDGTGATDPSNYTVTLNSNTTLGHVIRRTDAVSLPVLTAPLAPTGTQSVTLNNSSQSVSDWSTLRNLTLNSNAGSVAVPPGAYGSFTLNGPNAIVLGVPGATTPAVYSFQQLTLNNSNAQVQVVGPVLVIVAENLTVNGATVGNADQPQWLTLHAHGNLTLNNGASIHGYVAATAGLVTLNGNTDLTGGLAADRLTLNTNALLELLGPPLP